MCRFRPAHFYFAIISSLCIVTLYTLRTNILYAKLCFFITVVITAELGKYPPLLISRYVRCLVE